MAITTYSELKSAIARWIARDDFTAAETDEFIDLAETLLKRDPTPPESVDLGGVRADIQRTTGTLTASTATLALPSDFGELYRLNLTGSSFSVLRFVEPSQLSMRHRSGTGAPAFFTISDVIEFDVAPDSAYAYELSYWPNVTALSDSNTTNWVLTNYPDVYLSACLFYAYRYVKNDQEASSWINQYKSSSWSASETYRQSRYSQGGINIKTDTVNP